MPTAAGSWAVSPLAAVGQAFDALATPPTPLTFDTTGVPGLPQQPVRLSELRRWLLDRSTSPEARDVVWRELVAHSRRPPPDGPAWTVAAVGLALPGLTAAAGRLSRGWRGDTSDLDAELLTGFVARLRTLDASEPRVLGRLMDAAIRAGRRARAQAGDLEVVRVERAWSRAPSHPWDHPDWVLARAVAAGVVDRTEAHLIGATRLEDNRLVDVAAQLGLDVQLARDWRYRAEARLAEAIRAGELDQARTQVPRRTQHDPSQARLLLVKAARGRRRAARAPIVSVNRAAGNLEAVAPAAASRVLTAHQTCLRWVTLANAAVSGAPQGAGDGLLGGERSLALEVLGRSGCRRRHQGAGRSGGRLVHIATRRIEQEGAVLPRPARLVGLRRHPPSTSNGGPSCQPGPDPAIARPAATRGATPIARRRRFGPRFDVSQRAGGVGVVVRRGASGSSRP